MKVFIDAAEYDMLEHALIELGRTELSAMDKMRLSKMMAKFNAVHSISAQGKISMEPVK